MVANLNAKPYPLITRPEPQASQLASTLKSAGFDSLQQTFFTYQANASLDDLNNVAKRCDNPWLVFVSVAAVNFADQLLSITKWPNRGIIAVGTATEKALKQLGIDDILVPNRHNSEGVLALEQLQNISGHDVIIVRGDGGRELIAEGLRARGANSYYIESYKRDWQHISGEQVAYWREKGINTLIISSNALLESVVQLTDNDDNFWQNTCLWLVVSERIARNAKQLGLKRIVCSNGANDQAILSALTQLETIND